MFNKLVYFFKYDKIIADKINININISLLLLSIYILLSSCKFLIDNPNNPHSWLAKLIKRQHKQLSKVSLNNIQDSEVFKDKDRLSETCVVRMRLLYIFFQGHLIIF